MGFGSLKGTHQFHVPTTNHLHPTDAALRCLDFRWREKRYYSYCRIVLFTNMYWEKYLIASLLIFSLTCVVFDCSLILGSHQWPDAVMSTICAMMPVGQRKMTVMSSSRSVWGPSVVIYKWHWVCPKVSKVSCYPTSFIKLKQCIL